MSVVERSTATPSGELTLAMRRVLRAARPVVYEAFCDPGELAKWWGPEGFTTPREKIDYDLRPGGHARMTMIGPDGEEDPNSGHFRVVEPPERLSWHEEDIEHPMLRAVESTIEFVDLGGDRTKVVVTSRMVCADELVAMANTGWNSQFDRLERLLAAA